MKLITTVVGAAVSITLLAGCAGNSYDRPYYGDGYGDTRYDSFGYPQPYPGYRDNRADRRSRNNYYPSGPSYDGRNYYRR